MGLSIGRDEIIVAVNIRAGLPDVFRKDAAHIYWGAFGQKLGAALGPERLGIAFIQRVLDPDFAICALSPEGDRLLGIAGFKTDTGSMVGGGWSDLATVYGWFGAAWRAMLVSVLERGTTRDALLMDGIAVAAEARGLGIGSALLGAVRDEARKRGCSSVRLDVIDGNPRARALYERFGFVAGETASLGPLRHVFGFERATKMTLCIEPE